MKRKRKKAKSVANFQSFVESQLTKQPTPLQIESAAEAMKKQYLVGSHWYDLAEAALSTAWQVDRWITIEHCAKIVDGCRSKRRPLQKAAAEIRALIEKEKLHARD